MNSTLIIILIVVLLAALVGYAFIVQSIQQKRQQRERLLTGLNARARTFRHMTEGFPPSFLPRELKLLVQRGLVQVCEQLARLDSRNTAYAQEARQVAQAMTATQQQPELPEKTCVIEDPKQTQDVKKCLEDLYRYVFSLEGKRQLTPVQAEAYRSSIKYLVLQITVDSYSAQGRIAFEQEKFRLAKHYFEQALNLLLREAPTGNHGAKVTLLRSRLAEADQRLLEEEGSTGPAADFQPEDATGQEWKEFGKEEGSWKKKQVYD